MGPRKSSTKPSKKESFRLAYAEEDLIHRVAERVYRIRTKLGVSQKDLAERLGTKQPRIAMIEGGYENLTLRRVVRIAFALGCVAEDLLIRETPPVLQEPSIDRTLIKER